MLYKIQVCGYEERREEVSSTLFFKKQASEREEYPTLINVFYTTRGIMTKLSHPTSGINQLWRNVAYDSGLALLAIFVNPRTHTGQGYRSKTASFRGCARCGIQKHRRDYSKNQWRKDPEISRCSACIKKRNSNILVWDTSIQEYEINYDCIQCDAIGCSRFGASICCPTCKMTFYCSSGCKDLHRSLHTSDCRFTATIFDRVARGFEHKASESVLYGRAMMAHLAGWQDFEGLLAQAQYWLYKENWVGALEIYSSGDVFGEMFNRSPPEQREVMMGMCRCFYEIGAYDVAILMGKYAITMNRHFQEVHKYVALSHKAKGNYIEAVTTMIKAILYEAPWDEENIAANKALLKEIQLS